MGLTGSGGRISSSGSWGAIVIVDWEETGVFEAVVSVVSLATWLISSELSEFGTYRFVFRF